jgi:hypothetical protein
MGLVKYTMSLMNGARLAVAAQALGIAEAAYNEAKTYATSRIQFKKPIRNFLAVHEMLVDAKVNIEAVRTLLYETARIVDLKEAMEKIVEDHQEKEAEFKEDLKRFSKYASLFTPIVKAYSSETANKICYDAIQVHGGVGYTCEFNVERHYRDVRITNIYEGTTQLQVVAAIGGVLGGVVFERLNEYEKENDFSKINGIFKTAKELRADLESAISYIRQKSDPVYQEYHARRLVEMAADSIIGYLLCIDALKSEKKEKTALLFLSKAKHRVRAALNYISSSDESVVGFQDEIIDG